MGVFSMKLMAILMIVIYIPVLSSVVEETIRKRLATLSAVVSMLRNRTSCGDEYTIMTSGHPYGRSSNNMIELCNGLWFADHIHGSFDLPHWMNQVLTAFDTSSLKKNFCTERNRRGRRVINISANDLLNIQRTFFMPQYSSLFPPFTNETVEAASLVHIGIVASLWSHVNENVIKATTWLIENKLNGSFEYTAVHKRSVISFLYLQN